MWAAWWSGPPAKQPFRKPDAYEGGARSPEEALREAERRAGMSLVLIEPTWARAWARVLIGDPPWPREPRDTVSASRGPEPESDASATSTSPKQGRSLWDILGVGPKATLDEIRKAYRKRAKETHPDQGGTAEAFRELLKAYDAALARRKHAKRARP